MKRVAFYAPMKPTNHPTPSGDRRMARLFMEALGRTGRPVDLASTLRLRDGAGDDAAQAALTAQAAREVVRLHRAWRADPPALWFTYHCYYKAPDLIGPAVAAHFGIPYVIAEASRAKKRLSGPWAAFAAAAEAAIDRADLLLAMTVQDRFALDRDRANGQHVADFPPFLDPGPSPPPKPKRTDARLHLLTVAMMRGGDKMASYAALAAALDHLGGVDWHLTILGDGPERAAVAALLAPHAQRVTFEGAVADPDTLRQWYERADMLLWPGVNEAYGMVYLEAQAAGTPVIAEEWPGPRSVLAPGSALVPRGDGAAFAAAVRRLAQMPDASESVRAHILHHHGIDRAAQRLDALFGDLLP